MKFSEFFMDLGRPAVYYPKMAEITGGDIIPILFLCQLLYWTKVKKGEHDGWLWKTSDEIENETGLSYNRQKRAREILRDLGILEEHYRRSTHEMHFRINMDALNEVWEETFTYEVAKLKAEQKKREEEKRKNIEDTLNEPVESKEKKSLTEYIQLATGDEGARQAMRMKQMKQFLEKELDVVADDRRWEKFIDFAFFREKEKGERLETFVYWMLKHPAYDPLYWTPPKMKTMWAQAFTEEAKRIRARDPFDIKIPEIKEKEQEPMPDWFKKKHIKNDSNETE